MNWEAIGAIGETIGAIAVIVSLIYVALQIRHHTTESKTLRTQNLVSVNSEITAHVANNPELSKTIRIGMFDYDALNVDEQFQFNLVFYSIYNQYDFAYHQYLSGLLDDTFFKKMDSEIPMYMTLPGVRKWWVNDQARMSQEFVSYIERRLEEDYVSPESIPTLGKRTQNNAT